MKLEHNNNPWATHQPVLLYMCSRPNLKILELGGGHFSTGLLSYIQPKFNLEIFTYESDKEWYTQIEKYSSKHHSICWIENWFEIFNNHKIPNIHWDVIFVDQSPWEARQFCIEKLKYSADYIILHDCDHFPNHNFFQYDDHFKYYKVFMPNKPYPYITGPPTLLASNNASCDIDINYNVTEI